MEQILEICSVYGHQSVPEQIKHVYSLIDLDSFLVANVARDLFDLSTCCLCSHPSSTTHPSSTGIALSPFSLLPIPIILLISHLYIGSYMVLLLSLIGWLEPLTLTLAALRFGEEWWHFTAPTFQSSRSPPGRASTAIGSKERGRSSWAPS